MSKSTIIFSLLFCMACNKPITMNKQIQNSAIVPDPSFSISTLLAAMSAQNSKNQTNHYINCEFPDEYRFLEQSKTLNAIYLTKNQVEHEIKAKINFINKCNKTKCIKLCGHTIKIHNISLKQSVKTIFPVDSTFLEAPNLDIGTISTIQEINSKIKIKFSIIIDNKIVYTGCSTSSSNGSINSPKNDHPDVIAFNNSLRELLGFLRSIA